jgi:hypothetical protein
VDVIKSDLNKCGMRLQEARQFCDIQPFASTPNGFTCTCGVADEQLLKNAVKGQHELKIGANVFFKPGRPILIYDLASQAWEMNEIKSRQDVALVLKQALKNDFLPDSRVVALQLVEYKFYPVERMLKRKVDNLNFQPLQAEVTDFYATFFPDAQSVLYRIEVGRKEQIRGYIFLINFI